MTATEREAGAEPSCCVGGCWGLVAPGGCSSLVAKLVPAHAKCLLSRLSFESLLSCLSLAPHISSLPLLRGAVASLQKKSNTLQPPPGRAPFFKRCVSLKRVKKSLFLIFITSMNLGFSLLPHVLGPKYERRQRPRNSQKSSGQGGAGET